MVTVLLIAHHLLKQSGTLIRMQEDQLAAVASQIGSLAVVQECARTSAPAERTGAACNPVGLRQSVSSACELNARSTRCASPPALFATRQAYTTGGFGPKAPCRLPSSPRSGNPVA
jgi:hypothetical protein